MEDSSQIDDLRRQLYAREGVPGPAVARKPLPPEAGGVPRAWPAPKPTRRFFSIKFLRRVVFTAIAFFLITLGVALAVLWRGDNIVSSGNIDIEVVGPNTARAGDEVTLQITVGNRNSTELEFVDLIVAYPPGVKPVVSGSRPPSDTSNAQTREALGTITPGEEKNQTVKLVVFGDQGVTLPISVRVEYRVADSNAIFDKQVTHEIGISASPLALTITAPESVSANEEISLQVDVQSNAERELEGAELVVHYPVGFQFTRAEPAPSAGNNRWSLASLAPGGQKRFRIMGAMLGPAGQERAFRIGAGVGYNERTGELSASYSDQTKVVSVEDSQVALAVAVNGEAADTVVAQSGALVRVDIGWTNNLPNEVRDASIQVELEGETINPSSVVAVRGFYDSRANTIVWDQEGVPGLGRIAPGETGRVSLSFETVPLLANRQTVFRNPQVNITTNFAGREVRSGEAARVIETHTPRLVKFNSDVQLAGKIMYHTSPLPGSGPLPPEVGEETIYVAVLTVVNSSNDLDGAVLRATLPPYIRWVGNSAPAAESVSFQPATGGGGDVVWQLGRLRAGTGLTNSPRELVFQIGLTPSANQVGATPLLVSQPTLTARDTFTGETIERVLGRMLDTRLTADPEFTTGDDQVQP